MSASASKGHLYSTPLPAGRQGALYNAFSYPTKISAESVAVFIACHTNPGELVLDVFGGSGTTGVAALLCERPTSRMRDIAKRLGVEPVWGLRNAVVYDISVIGSLAASVMTRPPEPSRFAQTATHLIDAASAALPTLYSTTDPGGEAGELRHTIWSDVVACPSCGSTTTYGDLRVRFGPLHFVDENTCHCGYSGRCDDWLRQTETRLDPWTGEASVRRQRIPWRVYGRSGTRNWSRAGIDADARTEAMAADWILPPSTPLKRMRWGDLYRAGYHQGIERLNDLYTARNFFALATLWELIEDEPEQLRDALRLFVLSYNAAHSTLMTRVVLKKDSTDFVLSGAQSGVLYVSGMPVEKNVFAGLRRKLRVFKRAFDAVYGCTGSVTVINESSTDLALPSGSVDYVFTDPPFGAYIPYSEINQVNELWLETMTDHTSEAIVSPAQEKDVATYQSLLTSVFTETRRVLKPSGYATLVFHSAHANIWQALSQSLHDAGFEVVKAGILDKEQRSFKQVNGHDFVAGDPLLLLRKRGSDSRCSAPVPQHSSEERRKPPHEADPDRVRIEHEYSRLIGETLVSGSPVTLDAKTFYGRRRKGK